jgi:hypothetical protein
MCLGRLLASRSLAFSSLGASVVDVLDYLGLVIAVTSGADVDALGKLPGDL